MALDSSRELGHTSSSSPYYVDAIRAPSSPTAAVLQVQLQQAPQTYFASQLVPSMLEKILDSSTNASLANQLPASASAAAAANHWLLLLFAILVLINLIVILGNILVIVAVYASAKLRNVTNIFIVSLATADLLLGVLVLPYALAYEVLDVWIFGQIWCRGWLVTDVWISTASILNLCAISIDRYVAVTRPVKYRSIMTNRRAKTIVLIVWLLSFIICFPPLLTEWRPSGPGVVPTTYESPGFKVRAQPVFEPEQVAGAQETDPSRRRGATWEFVGTANASGRRTKGGRAPESTQRKRRDQPALKATEIRRRRRREDNDRAERARVERGPNGLPLERAQFECGGGILARATLASDNCNWPRCKLARIEIAPRSPLSSGRDAAATTEIVVTFAAGDIPRRRRRGETASGRRGHLLVSGGARWLASLANLRRASCCFSEQRGPRQPAEPLERLKRVIELRCIGELRPRPDARTANTSARRQMIRFPFGGNFIVLNGRLATTTMEQREPPMREKGLRNEQRGDDRDHGAHKSSPSRRVLLHLGVCGGACMARGARAGELLRAGSGQDGHLRPAEPGVWARADRSASKQMPAVATSLGKGRSLSGLAPADGRDRLPSEPDEGPSPPVIDDRDGLGAPSLRHPRGGGHSSRAGLVDELGAAAAPPLAARETSQLFPGQRPRRRRRQFETRGREEAENLNHLTVSTVHVNLNAAAAAAAAKSNESRSSGSSGQNKLRLEHSSGPDGGERETKGQGARATQEAEITSEGNQIAAAAGRQQRAQKPGQFGAHDSRARSPVRRSLEGEQQRQRGKPKKDFISNRKNRGRAKPVRAERTAGENNGGESTTTTGSPGKTTQICARLVLVAADEHDGYGDQNEANQANEARGDEAVSSSGPAAAAFIIISDDWRLSAGSDSRAAAATTAGGGASRISLVSQTDGNPGETKSIGAPPEPARGITAASGGRGEQGRLAAIIGGASPNEHIDHLDAAAAAASVTARPGQSGRGGQMAATGTEASRLIPGGGRRSRSLAANDPRSAAAAQTVGPGPPVSGRPAQPAARHNEADGGPTMMQFGLEKGGSPLAVVLAEPGASRGPTPGPGQTMGAPNVAYLANDLLPAARATRANKGARRRDGADENDQVKSFSPGAEPRLAVARVNEQNNEGTPQRRRAKRDGHNTVQLDLDQSNQEGRLGARVENSSFSSCVLFHDKTYVIYSALGSFYIPMLVMVFFYSRIYLVASRAQKAMQRGYMTTKWPPMQTSGGGKWRANGTSEPSNGKRWSRSSFRQTSGGSTNGNAARRRAQEGTRAGPAGVLQEGDRSQRPSGDSDSHRAGGNDDDGSSCYHAAAAAANGNHQLNQRANSPERVTLRIHRRTEPPPPPAAQAAHQAPSSPPGSLAISQQQQLMNSYQSFEAQRSTPARQQAAGALSGRAPLVVGMSASSESPQQDGTSSLIRLVSLEQQRILGNSGERRTRFSLDKGVLLPRRLFFSDKKRASLPPAVGAILSKPPVPPPPSVALAQVGKSKVETHGETPKPLPVETSDCGAEPEANQSEPEVARPQNPQTRQRHKHHGHNHHKTTKTKRTINTCRKCGRERLKVRGVAGAGTTERCKSADVAGRSDRSNSYGPMPTIVVVSWHGDSADGGGPHHSASATSHLLECQAAAAAAALAQGSMPALPLIEPSGAADEAGPMLDDSSTREPCELNQDKSLQENCKHPRRRKRSHRSSHTGSGLSLVANLPQQVRKQSIMLLSSLTTRSSETFRRLSMAAAHPLDSLMQANRSRASSRAATETGADGGEQSSSASEQCSNCSDGSLSPSASASAASNDDEDDIRDETSAQLERGRPRTKKSKRRALAGTSSPVPTSPKRTLDDYLMAVAGIDTSSSSDDEEGDGPDDDSESSSSSAGDSRAGGLTSMLRKENLMMIPSIQVVSPDDDDGEARCSPAAGHERQAREEAGSDRRSETPTSTKADQSRSRAAQSLRRAVSSASARPGSGGGADDLDLVDKKVKRTERLPPSAGLHRQGGLYESATSQRQSIVSSVLDMGELKLSPSSSSACASVNLNSDGPPSTEVQSKLVRHSPDLFRLLDVRSKRNKPQPPLSPAGTTSGQQNGQLVVVGSADASPQQVVRTQVAAGGRRRGAKRTSRWHAKRLRAETKAAKTVAIIVGGFIFCWLPFFTAYLSRAIICSSPDCIPQTWLSLSIWLGYMNSAINPVIYGLFSADFRHAFKNIVCHCRLRGPANVPRSNHLNHNIYHQVHRNHNQNTHFDHHNLGQQQQTPVVSALVGTTLKSIM